MSRWEEMMVFYGEQHQHPVNIAIHMVGVPIIVCAVFVAASLLRVDVGAVTVTGAWLVAGLGLAYYFTLDKFFAALSAPLFIGLVVVADRLAALPLTTALTISAAGFFGGYAAQFVGHAIDGRKPALFQSLWKAMITAPLFVVAEACKLAGLRKDLFAKVSAAIAAK